MAASEFGALYEFLAETLHYFESHPNKTNFGNFGKWEMSVFFFFFFFN